MCGGFAPLRFNSTFAMAEFAGEGLACVRGERSVFAGLSFRLTDGGALILAGPNGAGKSSLLRMMAGLLPLHDGKLIWNGSPIAESRKRIGAASAISPTPTVKPTLTVAESLRLWAVLWGGAAAKGRE